MNPINPTKILAILSMGMVLTGGLPSFVNASLVGILEGSGTVEVYSSTGSQITNTYVVPSTSLAIGNSMAMRFGTFTGSFTPTVSNADSWFSNFVGVNGFVGVGGSSLGKLSASITAGDLQAINAPVSSNSGVGVDGTKSIAQNARMYAVIWNSAFVSNSSGGNTFNPTASGLQAVVVTNPGWIMPLSSSLGLDQTFFTLSSGTVALTGLGSVDLVNKGLTMAVIPEPTVISLLLLGLAPVLALRKRRV
jgi:hypothetical protein